MKTPRDHSFSDAVRKCLERQSGRFTVAKITEQLRAEHFDVWASRREVFEWEGGCKRVRDELRRCKPNHTGSSGQSALPLYVLDDNGESVEIQGLVCVPVGSAKKAAQIGDEGYELVRIQDVSYIEFLEHLVIQEVNIKRARKQLKNDRRLAVLLKPLVVGRERERLEPFLIELKLREKPPETTPEPPIVVGGDGIPRVVMPSE